MRRPKIDNNVEKYKHGGIYELPCATCKICYAGQPGRSKTTVPKSHEVNESGRSTISICRTYFKQ
jgi:hypothetical protein